MAIAVPLGQHVTVGPAVVQPLVAAPIASTKGFPIAPFAVLCIITTILAIIATVALALIPIYTKTSRVTPNCTTVGFSPIFNTNQGTLPPGQLSTSNRAALESGLNQYVSTQPSYSRCTIEIRESNVDECPSARRTLKRRRRKRTSGTRRARQSNNNCANQAVITSSFLNCQCNCVGACLRKKVEQLDVILRSVSVSIIFPDPNNVVVVVTGVDIPAEPLSTTTTPPRTSTSTAPTTITTSPMTTPMIG